VDETPNEVELTRGYPLARLRSGLEDGELEEEIDPAIPSPVR
jgi:hypothetical protein